MKRPIKATLACLMLVSAVHAQSSLEQALAIEQKEDQQLQAYIRAQIAVNKAITAGTSALKSLKANLVFIKRVETDTGFRQCIVIEDNLARLKRLDAEAKKMQEQGEISKADYRSYAKELSVETKHLMQKQTSKQCTTGGTQ